MKEILFQYLLSYEDLHNLPFLVLGNKIDLPTAAPEGELREALGLQHSTTGKVFLASSKSALFFFPY